MKSKPIRLLGSLALAAGLLVSAGITLADACDRYGGCQEETKLPTFTLGPEWYKVLIQVKEAVVRTNGAEVSVQPTLETYKSGKGFDLPPMATVIDEVSKVGQKPYYFPGFPYIPPDYSYIKGPFDYPTGGAGRDFTWWSLFHSSTDTSGLAWDRGFAIRPARYGNDRQPIIVADRPSRRGSLTQPPLINLAEESRKPGNTPLTPGQEAWVRKNLAGKTVPGIQRVSVFMAYDPRVNKFVIKSAVYNFEPNLKAIMIPGPCEADPQAAECQKPKQCPPGSPPGAVWPNCDSTPPPPPPPPPPGNPQAGLDLAVERLSISRHALTNATGFASFWVKRVQGADPTDTEAEVWVGGTRICTKPIALPPGHGAAVPATCNFTSGSAPGSYAVTVTVNPRHNPTETTYANNMVSDTMTIIDPRKADSGGTKICLGDETTYVPCSQNHR